MFGIVDFVVKNSKLNMATNQLSSAQSNMKQFLYARNALRGRFPRVGSNRISGTKHFCACAVIV